jgi:RNA polymerase-binding transcription factor DksA
MDTTQLQHYARALEKERDMLEQQLDTLGVRTESDNEWAPKVPDDLDINTADESEIGDLSEETQIDEIVLEELETRYQHIMHALKKIEDGTYGICEISGQPIEPERLDANPAARTCKAHINDALPEIV